MKTTLRTQFVTSILVLYASGAWAQITPHEAVSLMKKGINLGNTLEPPDEGGWNNGPAQEYYFDLYRDAGFDVVRVPVRWDEHTGYQPPYPVSPAWMDRVEEVVDWGLERNLFIVINAHHESWIKENYGNASYRARFDSIWSQIATRFRDKPDNLIFEILNEPRTETKGLTRTENDDLHRRALSVIRRTNPTRLVIFQGNEWGGADELIAAAVPDDDYVIGSFHTYDPWPFGLTGEGPFGQTEIAALDNKFTRVRDWSVSTGVPVFLGEFGCHSAADYNLRMKHYYTFVDLAAKYGFTPCAWDDGGNFRILVRQNSAWNDIKDILIRTTAQSPRHPVATLVQDTMIRLGWTNMVEDHDSIIVQRRITQTAFADHAVLPPDAEVFIDTGAVQNTSYYYRIIARYADTAGLYSYPVRVFLPKYVQKERGLFLGVPHPVPGVIEAEDFDTGGEGIAYHDADALNIAGDYRPDEGVDIYDRLGDGYHVGNILPGEWMEYTIDVEKEGIYDLEVQLATLYEGGTFRISVGDTLSDTLSALYSGSWLHTVPVRTSMHLREGLQIMRFSILEEPRFNLDRLVFSLNSTGTEQPSEAPFLEILHWQGSTLMVRASDHSPIDRLILYGLKGAVVRDLEPRTAPVPLDMGALEPGIYLVRVISGNRILQAKVLHTK